jgi:hypothetical protein
MRVRSAIWMWLFIVVSAVTGCSGGAIVTTPIATPSPSPSPSVSPSPTPGPVVLSQSSIGFTSSGAANAQIVTPSQTNYAGSFSAATAAAGQANSCSNIAVISPANGSVFTVAPSAAGACAFTISGGGGQSATLSITVTVTNFGGS